MTLRQKEFCRHYIQGLTAAKAAEAAGYSACTAERNAAQILRSPAVESYILHRRKAKALFHHVDLETMKDQLLVHLKDPNPKVSLAAMREMRQIAKAFPGLFNTEPEQGNETDMELLLSCNKIEGQDNDSEILTDEEKTYIESVDITEIDPKRHFLDPDITEAQFEATGERLSKNDYSRQEYAEYKEFAAKRQIQPALQPQLLAATSSTPHSVYRRL